MKQHPSKIYNEFRRLPRHSAIASPPRLFSLSKKVMQLAVFGWLFLQLGNISWAQTQLAPPTKTTPTIVPLRLLTTSAAQETQALFQRQNAGTTREQLSIQTRHGAGFAAVNLPFIPIQPNEEYRLKILIQNRRPSYATFVSVIVRQHTSKQNRGTHYAYVPRENRVLLPSHANEQIPRYVSFKTTPTTRFITATILLTGNPAHITLGHIQIEVKQDEERDRLPGGIDPQISQASMLAKLAQRTKASARIALQPFPHVQINGQKVPARFYRRTYWDDKHTLHHMMGRLGVPIHTVPIKFGLVDPIVPDKPRVWTGPHQYNFREADRVIERALRANPNAYIIANVALIPYTTWGHRNNSEVARNEKGELALCYQFHNKAYQIASQPPKQSKGEWWCPSLYSERYRVDMHKALRAWFQHIRRKPYYKAIVGFHLFGGDDAQWSPWNRSGTLNLSDYSAPAHREFRAFLQAKYKTNAKLQAAWGRTDVTFATAKVPSVQVRLSSGQVFRHPIQQRQAIDHFTFESEWKSKLIIQFAKRIKELAGKSVLVGTYYEDGIYGRNNNHWRETERQRTTSLDYFVSPMDYGPYRRAGWAGGINACFSTLRLHNKLFLQELDLRTHVSKFLNEQYDYFVLGRLTNAREFHAVHRREVALSRILGMGQWYYSTAQGSFYADYAQKGIAEAQRILNWANHNPNPRPQPQVAVFVDEVSAAYVTRSAFGNNIFPATSAARSALWLSGVPFDLYGTQDLQDKRLPDYKVYVFLNSYKMTTARRNFINKHLKRGQRTLVFLHAAGYINDKGFSTTDMQRLTGIQIQVKPNLHVLEVFRNAILPTPFQKLLSWQGTAFPSTVGLKFFAQDPTATTLARYQTQEDAIVRKTFPQWTSVYIAKPGGLGPDLLHSLAKQAGIQPLSNYGNLVATDGTLLVAHGVLGGTIPIHLPRNANIFDVITGKLLHKNTHHWKFTLSPQETRIFGLRPPSTRFPQRLVIPSILRRFHKPHKFFPHRLVIPPQPNVKP